MKMYTGKPPKTEGWNKLGVIEHGGRWFVFVKEGNESEWLTAKIVSDGRALSKANYWLGWNGKRFNQQQDTFAMLQQRPELMHKVERMLEGYSLL